MMYYCLTDEIDKQTNKQYFSFFEQNVSIIKHLNYEKILKKNQNKA